MNTHKNINLRITSNLKKRMENHAESTFINNNSFILQAIKEKLDRENAPEVTEEKEGAEA